MLAGCATNPDSPVFTELARSNAMDAIAYSQKEGAAIVVRTKFDDRMCIAGKVTLRKVVDGKIVGDAITVGGPRTYPNIFKAAAYGFSPEHIRYGVDPGSSYDAIAPGRYAVVMVTCPTGDSEVRLGGSEWSLFGPIGPGISKAVMGENTITIERGQIVDAGTLTIKRTGGGLHYGTGIILASEAPESFREAMRKQLPELAPKITYSRFSFGTDLLTTP